MELKPTWRRALPVFWAFFWRFVVCVCVEFVALVAAAMAFATSMSGHPTIGCMSDASCHAYITAGNKALVPSFFLLWPVLCFLVIKLIIGKDFGGFRLALLTSPSQSGGAIEPAVTH